MYFGCITAGNRRTTVSKTSSMLCLRKLIGEPLVHVLVLAEGLCEALSCYECRAAIPAHVRMGRAGRGMLCAGIVGYTQIPRSDAGGGGAGFCGGYVASRKAARAVQSHMSVVFVSTPCRRR